MSQFSQHIMSGQHSLEDDSTWGSPNIEVPDFQGYDGEKIFNLLGDYLDGGCIPGDMTATVERILAASTDASISADDMREALDDAALIVRFVFSFSRAARRSPSSDATLTSSHDSLDGPPRFYPMDGFSPNQHPTRTRATINMILDAAGVARIPAKPYGIAPVSAKAWDVIDERLLVANVDTESGLDPDFARPQAPRDNPYREQLIARRRGVELSTLTALRQIARQRRGAPRHAV